MFVKAPEQLLKEIRGLVTEREPIVRATVGGKLFFLNRTFASEQDRKHSALIWVLRAQIGTLDKVKTLFVREGDYETFELLAIARNLFENLVWLRLFNRDPLYGLIFYEEFLNEQKQNTERMITKVEGEIVLFDEHEKLESDNFDIAFAALRNVDNPGEAEIKQAEETRRVLQQDLDMRARRQFTLYAAVAQVNGYGFQSHILREQVLPKHRATLTKIEIEIASYRAVKTVLLNPTMLRKANSHRNWRARAEEVGMDMQYDFLYSYTSKLLHSTPMNIITEKALSVSETLTMLEYAFVTISDLLDEIDRFSFPGQANVALIEA